VALFIQFGLWNPLLGAREWFPAECPDFLRRGLESGNLEILEGLADTAKRLHQYTLLFLHHHCS